MVAVTTSAVRNALDEAGLAIAQAIADDLELLAILHDCELSAGVLAALKAGSLEQQLSLRLASADSNAALTVLADAVASLPDALGDGAADGLAADYAEVYLRHTYRTSPTESFWLSEDGLDRQAPMLSIRALHRRHGVTMVDPYRRPEDHLVPELRFAAYLMAGRDATSGPSTATRFLDAHLLKWVHLFAARLVQRNAPPFYTALMVLTACYLEEARAHLTRMTGIAPPRVVVESGPPRTKARIEKSCGDPDPRYLPGIAPSW